MATKSKPSKPAPQPAVRAAAVTPADDTTAAFLREVDEALRYDKMVSLWHQHKWLIVAGIIVLLLGIAGKEGWSAWRTHEEQAQATRYYAISSISAEPTRRAQLTAFAKTATGGYKALAVLSLAQTAPTAEEKAAAYAQLAEDASQPQWLQHLARFNLALTLLGKNDAGAKSNLELLTQEGTQNSPLYPAALEQLTILAERANDTTAARGYTEKLLAVSMLSPDMRARALQRLGLLSTLPR